MRALLFDFAYRIEKLLEMKKPWLQDMLCIGIIFILSLVAMRFFLGPLVIESEDTYAGIVRLVGLVHVWLDGQFAARWLPDINFGYGYSLFNFYPPLFYYVAGVIFFIVRDFLFATNVTLVLSFFLSGVGMYFLARDFFGRPGALLAAVAYIFAPFHLCDIYRRTAFAQTFAYVFLPFVIFYINRVFVSFNGIVFTGLVLAVAGLILSHNITMLLFFPVILAYICYRFMLSASSERSNVAWVLLGIVLAFGLTAYYWVPANLEMKYVSHSNIYGGQGDFHQYFLTLYQLIFAPWTSGPIGLGMGPSFQLGWAHLLLVVVSLLVLIKVWRVDIRRTQVQVFWMLISVAIGAMTLKFAEPIWDAVSVLKYVQFPWRLFLSLAFCLSFLVGGVVLLVDGKLRWALALFGCLLLIAASSSFQNPIGSMRRYEIKDVQQFLFNTRPMDSKGFLPNWVKIVPMAPPVKQYEVVRGVAVIEQAQQISSSQHVFRVKAATPAVICFHQFYFLGWKVVVDGKDAAISYDNPWGVICFMVPEGTHNVRISLSHTPLRLAAEAASWASLVLVLWIGWVKRRCGEMRYVDRQKSE